MGFRPAATGQPWWAFHQELGWIVIDRSIPQNQPGPSRERLLVFRCSDWSVHSLEWEHWPPPGCIPASQYLTRLSLPAGRRAKSELEALQADYPEHRGDLLRQAEADYYDRLRERHLAFLAEQGITRGISMVRRTASKFRRGYRLTHCWRCKRDLDSSADLGCGCCEWILCDCGACGCGYGDDRF